MFPNFESHNLYCAKPLMLTCLSSAEASSSLPCKSVSCCTSSRSLAPNCCSALCRSLISLQKQLQEIWTQTLETGILQIATSNQRLLTSNLGEQALPVYCKGLYKAFRSTIAFSYSAKVLKTLHLPRASTCCLAVASASSLRVRDASAAAARLSAVCFSATARCIRSVAPMSSSAYISQSSIFVNRYASPFSRNAMAPGRFL